MIANTVCRVLDLAIEKSVTVHGLKCRLFAVGAER